MAVRVNVPEVVFLPVGFVGFLGAVVKLPDEVEELVIVEVIDQGLSVLVHEGTRLTFLGKDSGDLLQ